MNSSSDLQITTAGVGLGAQPLSEILSLRDGLPDRYRIAQQYIVSQSSRRVFQWRSTCAAISSGPI